MSHRLRVVFRVIAPSEFLILPATAAQLVLAMGWCVVLADAFFLNLTTVAFSGEPQGKTPDLFSDLHLRSPKKLNEREIAESLTDPTLPHSGRITGNSDTMAPARILVAMEGSRLLVEERGSFAGRSWFVA